MINLYQLSLASPRRNTLALLKDTTVSNSVFGDTLRRQLWCLAHMYDPRVPLTVDVGGEAQLEAEPVVHPFQWLLAEGPRPDPKYCLQRLRALWLVSENESGEINNDPVLPFRHQAALLQFLTEDGSAQRVLVADEVGLGKTVEAGLLVRYLLRRAPRTRVLYLTLGGLVSNVLQEFQRLDLPHWFFYGNVDETTWKCLNAQPIQVLTNETQLVVASIHKLCDSNRWEEQHKFLGDAQFDLIIVDECHTLRAYGSHADKQQVWFRSIRQLLEHHLASNGRVLFMSATPHQGSRDVFLNLVALCTGTPLNVSEDEKSHAARGKVIFRIKEHIRDWNNKRIFPPRDVSEPILADPPENYRAVLQQIAEHFDWIASTSGDSQARAVGFVKSQALQYAASSLRAGFAYLLRRLIRYFPAQANDAEVEKWASRLVPYRHTGWTAKQLLAEWRSEMRRIDPHDELEGELSEDVGPSSGSAELPLLMSVLRAYDALFDDSAAGAKFTRLLQLVDEALEPIVVFSQAVDTVYELELRLKEAGIEVYRLSGDMPMEDRGPVIQAFRKSTNARRVLVSSAAGGVGINLQVARIVVHFDLPWNPMALEQRVGRVHRIGSTKTIIVETILLRGSREAEVFQRITHRLHEIVRDLSADPVEREALFRRILSSVDPEALRDILSGQDGLDAVGDAVDQGRRAVDEADRYMREVSARTSEQRGRASMMRLVQFLSEADPTFAPVESRVYAVLIETDHGEFHQVANEARLYALDGFDERLVFDRTAASYLGFRRDQTGGLGHAAVDALIRSATDISVDPKARTSAWVIPPEDCDAGAGDILYFALETCGTSDFVNSRLRAWRIRGETWLPLDDDFIEEFLWNTKLAPSRRGGAVPSIDALYAKAPSTTDGQLLHFPLAAIGIRER